MLKKSILSNYQPRLRVTQIPVILIPGVILHQKHSRVAKILYRGVSLHVSEPTVQALWFVM